MERHMFDKDQPTGSMSLMNLRNSMRGLYQGDLMALRASSTLTLDDMEYPTNAIARAEWTSTYCTILSSTTKQEGNYSLEAVTGTSGTTITRTDSVDLSDFSDATIWNRCAISGSSAIQFFAQDSGGDQSRWDFTTNAASGTWQQSTIDLTTPDSNNGTDATLSDITSYGFRTLGNNSTYHFDTIEAITAMAVAVEGTDSSNYHNNVYSGSDTEPITLVSQASPTLVAPAANPRIDILTINTSGTLAWTTGDEAGSPTAKWADVTSDLIPICEVYNRVGETKIVDYEDKDANPSDGYILKDVRPLYSLGASVGGSDTQILYNDGGSLAGDSALTWTKADDTLTISSSVIDKSRLRITSTGIVNVADNAVVKIVQDHASSSEPVLEIGNDGTGTGIEIAQAGNGQGIRIDHSSTQNAISIAQDTTVLAANKHLLWLASSGHHVNADSALLKIEQGAGSTEPALEIDNDGTGYGMEIHSSSGDGLKILAAAGKVGLFFNSNNTTADIHFSAHTAPSSPVDGDFWFDGSNLKLQIGGTTYTLTKT